MLKLYHVGHYQVAFTLLCFKMGQHGQFSIEWMETSCGASHDTITFLMPVNLWVFPSLFSSPGSPLSPTSFQSFGDNSMLPEGLQFTGIGVQGEECCQNRSLAVAVASLFILQPRDVDLREVRGSLHFTGTPYSFISRVGFP